MTAIHRSLSLLVHGNSKAGKSWFGDTTPAPRLVLDAEMGSRFTPSKKIVWDPIKEEPPKHDGSWDTCIVYVHKYETVDRAYQWLVSGKHPFNSVVMDSVSEIQQRCVDSLVGADPMKTQDWGTLLRQVSRLIRQFRDLVTHPTHPLSAVVIIAMTREKEGVWRSYVQGQLADAMPYFLDVIGYLYTERDESGALVRKMLVSPHDQFQAGERVGGRLGDVVINPNVEHMLDAIYGTENA